MNTFNKHRREMQFAKKYISLPLLKEGKITINEITISNWRTYYGELGKFHYKHLHKISPGEFPVSDREDKQATPIIIHTPLSLYRPPYHTWEELRMLYDIMVIMAYRGDYIFPRDVEMKDNWIINLIHKYNQK